MHARRTAYLLTAAFLTAGCVAVPHGPAPGPPDRPAALDPAAERAPSPLPTWPAPTQAAPRETLATTEPRPEPARARGEKRERERAEGPQRPKSPKESKKSKEKKRTGKNRARAVPHPPKKKPLRTRSRPSTVTAGQPELRRLCRQAEQIDAPMGAADLCRGMYGP
ncbi:MULTISPECIES: hypothetical protein [unclassified Streptomyces]|uniref:hypothetical protein n=1 Tax=unclassified Streptomyces TaxID=2593676 RepID=UPI0006B04415|nr:MULTISPECIES: hypothetical protein [unclassified Streptomyces]KOX24688.1 hypothetical protein ADL06_20830 [Streptomyces sp. NRRL F-6491]KOX38911.1 hypothetical protein ADL08_25945 [Streptomyces sp. NRRL F-6492]